MMFRRLFAAWQRPAPRYGRRGFNNPATYHWRCECGAESQGAYTKADAEHNAMRHQLSKPVGHPTPEVYTTGEEYNPGYDV
jgi:hypothetical protein